MMRRYLQTLLAAGGLLLVPMAAGAEPLNLESARAVFSNPRAGENCVCILHDGWNIAFLSHDGKAIGAAIIAESGEKAPHQHDLSETVARVAELVGMETPESIDFDEGKGPACSLLVDQAVLGHLAEETRHVFDSSPLAAMAYLLKEEYFCINAIRPNGFIHWKTIKKSGVELLMPMVDDKLAAIEVTGRQQMNEFASEVLADKLGLGRNNVPLSTRQVLCQKLNCTQVTYMNSKSNALLARTDRRAVIGKRQAVARLLAHRNEGALPFADQASAWPEKEKKEEPAPPPPPAEAVEEKPLTPGEAREAYIKAIQAL